MVEKIKKLIFQHFSYLSSISLYLLIVGVVCLLNVKLTTIYINGLLEYLNIYSDQHCNSILSPNNGKMLSSLSISLKPTLLPTDILTLY